MRSCFWFLAIGMACTAPAFAQPTDCSAQRAAVAAEMETAKAQGRMLQRRQLAERLAALEASCPPATARPDRAAEIGRLEQRVAALRAELEQAEAQLRQLRNANP